MTAMPSDAVSVLAEAQDSSTFRTYDAVQQCVRGSALNGRTQAAGFFKRAVGSRRTTVRVTHCTGPQVKRRGTTDRMWRSY